MADFQYTNVPGKMVDFLQKIRSIGVPAKVTTQWLESLGYKSKNDRSFLPVLEFLGLVDGSHLPTQLWTDYRGKNYKIVLGKAIKQAYSELFEMYPDADKKDNDDLNHFFSTKSKAGEQVIGRITNTFKALVGCAEFNDDSIDLNESTESNSASEKISPIGTRKLASSSLPNVHIDLQIHISPEASPEQIEKIFESMAKHLLGKINV
jgi:hypothetical protein